MSSLLKPSSPGKGKGSSSDSNKGIFPKDSFIADKTLLKYLSKSQVDSVRKLTVKLLKKVENLKEKFNINSQYLGYKQENKRSDSMYIYFQKKILVVDINHLGLKEHYELEKKGFEFKHRCNFQGKSGWLTGWRITYEEMDKRNRVDIVVSFMAKAFK